jgi:hypothetical protein
MTSRQFFRLQTRKLTKFSYSTHYKFVCTPRKTSGPPLTLVDRTLSQFSLAVYCKISFVCHAVLMAAVLPLFHQLLN